VRVLEDVVAEHDDERLAGGEVVRHPDHLRDPARLRLHLVGEIEVEQRLVGAPDREVPVAEEVDHLAGVTLAGHDEHLLDARELQQLQRVVDHRPAADREQVLVRDARQLAEPRRLTSRTDESLRHARDRSDWRAYGCAGRTSTSTAKSPAKEAMKRMGENLGRARSERMSGP
jgi:hypothetical protein